MTPPRTISRLQAGFNLLNCLEQLSRAASWTREPSEIQGELQRVADAVSDYLIASNKELEAMAGRIAALEMQVAPTKRSDSTAEPESRTPPAATDGHVGPSDGVSRPGS
jgi:hypothetical protein